MSQTQQRKKQEDKATDFDGSLTVQTYITNATCESGNGSIVTEVHGGTAPYQFSLNGGDYQNTGAYYYLPGNNYTLTVKDATGNTKTTQVTVTNTYPASFGKIASYTLPSDCITADASVTIQPTIGTPPFTYSLDLITFQSSNTFTNVAPGSYTYYLKDAHGCLGSINSIALTSCNFSIAYSYTGSECGAGGTVNVQDQSGGTPPYTYSIDGVHYQSEKRFEQVLPGIFSIYVKDANGKVARFASQMYDNCSIVLQAVATPSPCQGSGGSIAVTPANGTPPYQYSIDGVNFQNSNLFSNLFPGGYTIIAKDSKGDIGMTSATVKGGCLLMVLQPVNASCSENNGKIIVHANGGTEPYQYSIDGTNFQTSPTIENLAPEEYSVTTKDADGLEVTGSITVSALQAPVISNVTTTPASCQRDNGTLTITASGGTSPLQYSLNDVTYQPSNVFTSLPDGGLYQGWVKDANGCKAQSNLYTVSLYCISAQTTISNTSCGASNGSITVTASHGMEPYQYSLDGVHYQSSNLFTNLAAGEYRIDVKDNNGMIQTIPASVAESCIKLKSDVVNTTCGTDNGIINATASGGLAPYQYSIDGIHFQNGSSFANLSSGDYVLTVKDAVGTLQTQKATIAASLAPRVSINAMPATCADGDGTLTASAASGTAPYQYKADGGDYQAAGVFYNMSAGLHPVMVKDAAGCISTISATVPFTNTLAVEAGNDVSICEGTQTVLQATSVATTFHWEPAQAAGSANLQSTAVHPLVTTKYYVTASTPLCTATDSVIVTVFPAPDPDAGDDMTVCYGKNIQLNGRGGISYRWQPAQYLSDATVPDPVVTSPAGRFTYLLTVTDDKGCQSIKSDTVVAFVTPPAKVFAGNDTIVIRGLPFQLHAEDINQSGFTHYQWSPAAGLNIADTSSPFVTINTATRYQVTAYTPDGCAGTDEILIKTFAGPDIYVPSAFTPNRDGINDVVHALPVGIVSFRYFAIYNRFGHLVFYTTQPSHGWDGNTDGKEVDADSYVWMAAGIDINKHLIQKKGTFVLVR